ncbi:glycoside hydrolase [Pelagicoccus sp. NFK12]|uniref:Glycoside hydrolase n=1 Tax=Pelagicoccus enzymogenes TaxID=2773457 RepID=A0A927IFG5_9BACT|nr:alpha-L-rhamnosidase C-terminal domain-containing protein [Pelagicoccus enzymogenes]MBD5780072.1 glycoside hydrolase [Pelagicoccus enzymogenes]
MKLFLFLITAFALSLQSFAQEAQWIWGDEDGPDNTWRCFRKELTLTSIPEAAVAKVAADSKFWLWINGEQVIFEGSAKRGPHPNGTYYDLVDIRPFLVEGQNSIAALAWYWGRSGFSHVDSGQGGFFFSAQLGDTTLGSDATWHTLVHPAYSREKTADPQPNYRLSEHNINYFAADNQIEGWHEKTYAITDAWKPAVPKGAAGAQPWGELRQNPLPLWMLSDLRPYENASTLPNAGTDQTIVAKLPYNAQVIPYLKVNAPAGKTIDIRTDAYQDGGIQEKRPQWATRSVYTTTDGIQEFEAIAWLSGHEVHYQIPEGVEILELKYRETGYATEFTGSFHSDDPFYNKLWTMARRTLYINMRDTFFDCPTRERAQWWGDVVNQLGEVFYTFDLESHRLIKKAIYNLAEFQKPNGQLYSPVPGKDRSELPLQMLNSVGWYGFWTYYLNTGDAQTIRDVYPYVKRYLSLWELGEEGLVVTRREGMWFWIDWGDNSDYGVLQNCWYYLAQKAAIEMAKLTGNEADVAGYRSNMQSIEDNFDALWNGTAYNSGQFKRAKDAPDDRANAMAVLAGLASPNKYPAIKKVLEEQEFASPYMEKYVLEALCVMGEEEASLQRMKKRYTVMVDAPYTTLWEFWKTGGMGTYNHGWNAPNTILSQYIAGVAVVDPAWETYHVKPQLGSLNSIQVRVPSVKGDIDVDINKTDKTFSIQLLSPEETTALVGIPKKHFEITEIKANDTPIWSGEPIANLEGITPAGEDQNYLLFTVAPGQWTFTAKAK